MKTSRLNTGIRIFLLSIRLAKTGLIILLCYGLLNFVFVYSSEYIATLWKFDNEGAVAVFSSVWDYLLIIGFIVLSFLGIELILVFSSRKYKNVFFEKTISLNFLKQALASQLVKPEVSSINYTTAWYLFGTILAFWVNWAFIFALRLSPADNLPLGGLLFYGTSILFIIIAIVCFKIEDEEGRTLVFWMKNRDGE